MKLEKKGSGETIDMILHKPERHGKCLLGTKRQRAKLATVPRSESSIKGVSYGCRVKVQVPAHDGSG